MEEKRKKVTAIEDLRMVQEERFANQMDIVFKAHPYYMKSYNKMNLVRSDIKSLNDLNKLPLTYKEDWIDQPDAFQLDMNKISWATREEKTLWEVIFTTGSTSAPTPFYDTSYDHYARISQLKRTVEIVGISSKDTIINLFPLTSVSHQGSLSVIYGSQAIGAKLISAYGGGYDGGFGLIKRSIEAIKMIEEQKVTVLWGIGFFLRRLIMVAQEMGADFSSVNLVMPMGEACSQGMREDIRRRMDSLGAKNVSVLNGYGFTEMQGPSMQCKGLNGFHLSKPARYFFEFLDPKTLQPVPEGEPGLVVMTHLDRRGTCLIRYVVGDICRLTYEPCPVCGSWEPRFDTIPYRTGSIIKVKGTLVNVSALYDILGSINTIEEYEIIATQVDLSDPFSEDVLLIQVACEENQQSDLQKKLPEVIRRAQEVTPKIQFVPIDYYSGALDQNYKFKRFKDERQRDLELV